MTPEAKLMVMGVQTFGLYTHVILLIISPSLGWRVTFSLPLLSPASKLPSGNVMGKFGKVVGILHLCSVKCEKENPSVGFHCNLLTLSKSQSDIRARVGPASRAGMRMHSVYLCRQALACNSLDPAL